MSFSIRVAEPMPTRPCSFCLSLQNDGVFADFATSDDGCVYLLRISFDGFGCCNLNDAATCMDAVKSRTLIEAVNRAAVEDPKIVAILLKYFRENSGVIWNDALRDHDLM